jgi:hypothetical protein
MKTPWRLQGTCLYTFEAVAQTTILYIYSHSYSQTQIQTQTPHDLLFARGQVLLGSQDL